MTLPHRYVFVGGLHRSGTSLVSRLLSEHPDISGISGAPVPENEGCYLQGAIPHTARHGVPCQFATDPDQHLVEGSQFDSLHTRIRLEADWAPWFDPEKPWRIEKSPVNLTRMRLYQSLFPLAQFIIVVRQPQYVAAAMRKWTDIGDAAVMQYWGHAHELVREDLSFVHNWLIVRYEDLVRDPLAERKRMFAFLDLDLCPSKLSVEDGNARYDELISTFNDKIAFAYAKSFRGGRHALRAIDEAVQFRSATS